MDEVIRMAEFPDRHLGIIQEALADYRRWFDGDDPSDVAYRKAIDAAFDAIR